MPAKDRYHDQVRNALVKDGWTITHDPLHLSYRRRDLFVDLGAERILAAEKVGRKIAVEVKSFLGLSILNDLEHAVGQFVLYEKVLTKLEPNRQLFLALPMWTYTNLFEESIGELLLDQQQIRLLVFDPNQEEIIKWTP